MDGISVRLRTDTMNWWLALPTTGEVLQNALREMGAKDGAFTIDKCKAGFNGKLDALIIGADINEANCLAARLAELTPAQAERLEAVMETELRFGSIARLIDYTHNTGVYDLFTDVINTENLARHYIYDSGLVQMPREWAAGIDLYAFGITLEQHEKGFYTDHGYLIPTGLEWTPVFEKTGEIPAEYRVLPERGPEEEPARTYETGAEFWRDSAVSYGMDEALGICGRYLDTQLRMELPKDEKAFCRELFAAMYEAAGKTDPAKLVYPYDFQKADERTEASYYHDSRKRNAECAHAIDEAIHASCYKTNYYNLEIAAMKAVHDFGFARVNLVLAHNFQQREYDGRFSSANKQWAREFSAPEKAFGGAVLNAHPVLIEDFANYARKLYDDVGAARFALPGRPESGEVVHGYEIVRAIAFDDQRGFAIGINPDAVSQFVAWQFTVENGRRDYYWGAYNDTLAGAAENYVARIIVHMSGSDVREKYNYLAATEISKEQNYNMIDGLRNNEAVPRPDLTDGQTHEEIAELAPETLTDEKASVMDRIKEARETPKPPPKPRPEREKKTPELER